MPSLLTLALIPVLASAPARLELEFPHATLAVRPGEGTVSLATGLDWRSEPTEARARSFLTRHAGAFGLTSEDELRLVAHRGTVFRFERRRLGVPVQEAEVVVTFDAEHLTMVFAGGELPMARGAFVLAAPEVGSEAKWLRSGRELRPTWLTKTPLVEGVRWVFTDAETGEVLERRVVRWTANGRVFEFSPSRSVSGLCPQIADGGYTACASPASTPLGGLNSGATSLSGPRVVARNCLGQGTGTSCVPRATPNGSGDFDETPNLTTSTSDRFGEVMAYSHGDRFSTWLDTLSPPFQGGGGLGVVDVMTNVGNYEGAYFDNSGPFGRFAVRLGQGPLGDWAYDADILCHEMGHGAVDRTSGFSFYARDGRGINGDPGSLNEGTADCLSLAFKGSPQLGEWVGSRLYEGNGGPSTPYLRTVANKRMCQITSIDSSTLALGGRVGEIHADGVIWGTFFWALRQRLATVSTTGICSNCNAAEVVLLRALESLGSNASFREATLAVQQVTASVFGASAAQLVGCMSCEWNMLGCEGRIREVFPNETHEALLVDSGSGSIGGQTPATFQYGLDVPANTTVGFNRFAIESGTLTILAKFGAPIQWSGNSSDATHTITSQGQTLPPQASAGRWYFQGTHDGAAIRRFGFRVAFQPIANTTTRPVPQAISCSLGSGVPSGCACAPQCTGKQCGSDGCGGSCGTCQSGQTCSASSQCGCTPSCAGKQCGADGCGGSCGTCANGSTCGSNGLCSCTPQCSGKQCGSNGCGGTCGTCATGLACTAAGQCSNQTDPCEGRQCGPDGSGGSCGTCLDGFECTSAGTCRTQVDGCGTRLCGPDGLGGSCGTCSAGELCSENGTCVADPGKTGCGCSSTEALGMLILISLGLRRVRKGR